MHSFWFTFENGVAAKLGKAEGKEVLGICSAPPMGSTGKVALIPKTCPFERRICFLFHDPRSTTVYGRISSTIRSGAESTVGISTAPTSYSMTTVAIRIIAG